MINKEEIDVLIAKYFSGEANPEEAMLLENWKAESFENKKYFEKSERLFGIERLKINENEAWNKVMEEISSFAKIRPLYARSGFILKIAAAVLLFLSVGFLFKFYNGTEGVRYLSREAESENEKIILDDNSKITVNAYSKITYTSDYGKKNRLVRLNGSAHFEVSHSEQLPFTVDAGNVYIKDIGTIFDVITSKDTDTVYVRVEEGVVLLFDSAGSELIIKASEKAVYVKSSRKIIKQEKSLVAEPKAMNFSNERLEDAIVKLEQEYGVKIEFENNNLKSCRITTKFNGEPLEQVLSIITETLGIKYVKTSSGYKLTGNSCNN